MPRDFAGKYERYPDLTGERQAEGGRRLQGVRRESRVDAPLVTIITVCFNSAKTIEQTIRSVRDQTYDNIEYVVVDGASSDGTVDILRRHEGLIDYYISERDEGLYYAMNKGIELARGELILVLNSDDWFATDGIEALVRGKDYSGCDFVAALARYVDEGTGQSKTLRSMPFDDSVYFRMPLRHETMLIPAEFYERIGHYDTDYRIIADRDYTARLFDAGATFYEVPRTLLNFRTSGVSNTNIALLDREKDMLLGKEFPFLSVQERHGLNDRQTACAEVFAEIANAHLDQPKFVKACRALLEDRRANDGKLWQSKALEKIGAADLMAWPKVSVILPFYEAESTIGVSLDSVRGQSLSEFEIICVNDCAIDDSQSIVDAYMARDSRVKCIHNPRNIGLGASRNTGIRAANGRYIFHLDPDDTLPPNALEKLYNSAVSHGSDMVKGAYKAVQGLHQQQTENVSVKYPGGARKKVVPNTSLRHAPRLLHTTEGHWSYLYAATFARRVAYPTDLKMGQDSIFLVNAVARARKITLLPKIVYNYESNSNSAMNSFSAQKYFDGLEWRRRAWHVLRDAGFLNVGERLLFTYWSRAFFEGLEKNLKPRERRIFWTRLGSIFREAGYPGGVQQVDDVFQALFETAIAQDGDVSPLAISVASSPEEPKPRIATFSTQDYGGAGLGSQRRVKALRKVGVDAHIYCAFRKTDHDYVHSLPYSSPLTKDAPQDEARLVWKETAVLRHTEEPSLKAYEMFSKPGSIIDFHDIRSVFESTDIVHFHWVSGIFDYANTDLLADKPVVWTLADMNAFTGGCHYSEGCEGYKNDCRNCPLLGSDSERAHETWKIKRDGYAKIKNLQIICPSQWLADRAQQSALFGDRQIHMIPNALPSDHFKPTNRLVARRRLGLPLDRKLIVFGADSLNNLRKGGDILRDAVRILKSQGRADGVEGLFFGSSELDLAIPAHHMGHVSEEEKLSLIYAAADVYAFPSREDNAPLTIAESMLSGTPVVGFRVGNVPELVTHRDTGYIARYLDAEDFAKGLSWTLSDTNSDKALRRRLRNQAKVRTYNDPETAAERHIALYIELGAR